MKWKIIAMTVALFSVLLMNSAWATPAAEINDSNALHGVRSAKGLFDVSVKDPATLEFYLKVIQQTYDDLVRQGQKPELVIAFRGPTVRLINTETWSFSEEDQQILGRISEQLDKLEKEGIRLEACSVATGLFKVDNEKILPQIHVVGNTFVSLIGYQAQGYGLIPIK